MRLTGIGANNGIFNAAAINQKVSRLNNDNNIQGDLAIQQAEILFLFPDRAKSKVSFSSSWIRNSSFRKARTLK